MLNPCLSSYHNVGEPIVSDKRWEMKMLCATCLARAHVRSVGITPRDMGRASRCIT